jgi:hypothetical protein
MAIDVEEFDCGILVWILVVDWNYLSRNRE